MNSGFGSILYLLRSERGRSQRAVANDLGISQALLSHYENGIREPKLDFIVRLCGYYDVSADYILGRTDDRNRVTLPRDTDELRRLSESVGRILETIGRGGGDRLRDSAARYFGVVAANVENMLSEPEAAYDPMRDANMKTAEAALRGAVKQNKVDHD
jgi:transcriptional regulator with XRE-family HTH domain